MITEKLMSFDEAVAQFDPVVGLEIHVELSTATKLFGWYKYLIVSSVEMEELDETLIEETLSTLGIILFDGLLVVPEEGV